MAVYVRVYEVCNTFSSKKLGLYLEIFKWEIWNVIVYSMIQWNRLEILGGGMNFGYKVIDFCEKSSGCHGGFYAWSTYARSNS